MPLTWEVRDYDQEFFRRELDSFVPREIFDSHAHLYKVHHFGGRMTHGPAEVGLQVFREQIDWIMPGRRVEGLFFGVGFSDLHRECNEFIAAEVRKDPGSRGQLLVAPGTNCDQVRAEVRRLGLVGLKVYHTFVSRPRTWDCDVSEFLTEDHVRAAHEEELAITLHMVKQRAMADKRNQETIRSYCERYPRIKMILAHAARGFNPFHTVEGIGALKGLRNVWCDSSGVTEAGGFEAIIETLGHDRLLWGSDYPVSHHRGRCVAIGDQFLWLYEDTLDWKTVSHEEIRPVLIGLESLRALKLACLRMRLSDTQVEDIFRNNARRMLNLQ